MAAAVINHRYDALKKIINFYIHNFYLVGLQSSNSLMCSSLTEQW